METEHSPAEWQELIKQLRKVVADQGRSREDRRKAQSILERIGAHAPRARPTTKQWSDSSFYTDLIQVTGLGTIVTFAFVTVGAYALAPILLIIMMIPLAVIGFFVSMHEREKWK